MSGDEAVFRLVNQGCANRWFDAAMPVITHGKLVMGVLVGLGVLFVALAYRQDEPAERRRAWRVVLVALLAVGVSELIGSHWLKHAIGRPRPPVSLDGVRLLVGLGHSMSFPSAHAANSAAVCWTASRAWPRRAPWLLAYAALVSFSRVYVGVHYPTDVLGGALLGAVAAEGLWRLSGRWLAPADMVT